MKKYSLQFLDDEAFERLPYPDMDVSLGVADPVRRAAYVRRTGLKSLDLFNAAHELEHLEDGKSGKHADHFENGVYYKKFSQVLPALAPLAFLIPGVGPALGGALSSVGGAFSGALGAIPGVGGALSGAAGSIGGGIGSALGIGGGGAAGAGAGGAHSLGANMATQAAGSINPAYSAAPNVIKSGMNSFGKGASDFASQNLGSMFGGGGSPMDRFQMPQEQGSFSPNSQPGPNVVAGASGSGSGGGPGAAPGSIGGGAVSKLKAYLQQQGGNSGNGPGGNF